MSNTNVTKEMSFDDVNSAGKPYHQHGDKIEKPKVEHVEHGEAKEHIPHGHDNQYHKDIKGSHGSRSSELGDRKVESESS